MSLRTIGQSVSVIALLLCAAGVLAQDKAAKPDAAKPAPAKATHSGFDKMKTLVGEWVVIRESPQPNPYEMRAGGQPPAKPAEGAKGAEKSAAKPDEGAKGTEKSVAKPEAGTKSDAGTEPEVITYKLISSGSVVHESMFPGSPHEMVTVYHLDGDDLVLTHYCALGNQPRMKAEKSSATEKPSAANEKSSDANKIVFKFAGGTNLDPAKDAHMHDVTFTFIDPDHIRQEWTFYDDGKAAKTEKFDLMRKK